MAKHEKRGKPGRFSIPDTGENVMRSVVTAKPKKPNEWKYLKRKAGK